MCRSAVKTVSGVPMKNKLPELLAPAGSAEGLRAVVAAGADAVYIGGSRFGARAFADNPNEEDLLEAIDYAHLHGVSVYLTVNTLVRQDELSDLIRFLKPYYERGLDAVLVQDLGVVRLLHSVYPDLPIHTSTQMTVTGRETSEFLKRYGVTRIVPARELSLPELAEIKQTGLEVEVFIHGALCYCYSGQCLFSSALGGRSGNRGRCAQPCRLTYALNGKKPAKELLSPRDLCALEHVPELIKIGVDSLKIEGRMKQPEYAAGVVSVYRKYLDIWEREPLVSVSEEDKKLLFDLYNREGFTDGYLHRHNGPEMMAVNRPELSERESRIRRELYASLRARYLQKENPIEAEASAAVYAGAPFVLTLSHGDASVTIVDDKEITTAQTSPATVKNIAAQLGKTGGSGFTFREITVDTDGQCFLPVSTVKGMRRRAIAGLQEELLGAYRRKAPDEAGIAADFQNEKTAPHLEVLVSTKEQFRAAVKSAAEKIIAEYTLLDRMNPEKTLKMLAGQMKSAGSRLCLAFPRINREGRFAEIYESIPAFLAAGVSGFLVRDWETFVKLAEMGHASLIEADANLYTWNNEALAFFRENGVSHVTAPYELSESMLKIRDNKDSVMSVYGRLPLMVSAQCPKKTTGKCNHRQEYVSLTDRKHVKFPVKTECDFCYNVIYNSVPLCLFGDADKIMRLGFSGVRLEFTDETAEETEHVLKLAVSAFSGEKTEFGKVLQKGYTRGHFQKGAE